MPALLESPGNYKKQNLKQVYNSKLADINLSNGYMTDCWRFVAEATFGRLEMPGQDSRQIRVRYDIPESSW